MPAYPRRMTMRSRRHALRTLAGAVGAGAVAFLAGPVPAVARPAIVAGGPCKKAGRTRTVGATTYRCTERGGALVWARAKGAKGADGSSARSAVPVRAMASSELVAGTPRIVVVTGADGTKRYVAFSRAASGVVAFEPTCTHQGYQLEVRDARWYCDYHGSVFAADSGEVVAGPASRALRRYEASESGGSIYVAF